MKIRSLMKLSVASFITINILYAEDSNKKLDTVTVTANKVEENIQDVPQSITVIDKAIIEEKGITDIIGIIKEIPNMTSIPDHGMQVNFRGLNSSAFTNNNPIVIYIDGVPITDRMGYDISMANVQRVEVLRGPQGTLYGKDAIGGVINIITKEPTDTHSGDIGIEYGKYNHMLGTFNITGPIKDNKLYYGFNAQLKSDDGWITNNLKNDDKANKITDNKFSTFVLYKPTDRLSTKLTLSRYDVEKDWGKNHTLPASSDLSQFNRTGAENVNFDVPTFENTLIDSQSLNINYNFDKMNLTSVTTHKKLDLDSDFDLDYGNASASNGFKQFNYTENEEWTQEIRLSNTTDNMKWVTGLYLDDGAREQGPYGVQTTGGLEMNAVSKSDSDTKAIFGQTTFSINSNLELTLGGRLQKITKDIDMKMYMLPIGTTGAPSFTLKDEKSWNTFIPKAALAYKLNENLTPFISISKGYMPGGYNYFAMSGTADDNSFEPQTSINYETGIKGVIDNLSFSASIFRMDIKDIHIYRQSGGMFLTDNAKKAHSQGIEFDFNYFPTDQLEISGAIGFIEAKYDDYDAGNKKYDGEKIENTPSHTASLTVAYHHPTGIYGRVSGKNEGSTSFFNSGNQKFEKQGSHTVTDIKLGYKFSDFDVYTYINNLTNEEYITSYKNNGSYGIATFNDPRTYGIGLRYKF